MRFLVRQLQMRSMSPMTKDSSQADNNSLMIGWMDNHPQEIALKKKKKDTKRTLRITSNFVFPCFESMRPGPGFGSAY